MNRHLASSKPIDQTNAMIDRMTIEQLSTEEKIQLVEDIWDSLAANPERIPVTPAQQAELDRRWVEHQKNPASALSLDEFKRQLAGRL